MRRRSFLFATALAGTFAPALRSDALTNLAAELIPGQWLELPGTALRKVTPSRESHPAWGMIGPRAVTDAWGGAAFDSTRDVLVLTGGGHYDYGGNEVYEFHLRLGKWIRATEPSPMRAVGRDSFEVIGSEAPVSSHTYDGLTYIPTVDAIFKFGGSYYSKSGGSYDHHGYFYSVASKTWRRLARAPRGLTEVASDFDSATGLVVIGTGSGLMYYDPKQDSWRLGPQGNAQLFAAGGIIDPHNRLFVQVIARTGAITYFDLESPAVRMNTPVSGPQPWGAYPGAVYDAIRRRLVIWSGGRDVWLVRTDDWEVVKLPNQTGPAPRSTFADGTRRAAGIYSRWQYVDRIDAYIGYQHYADNVWLYRLPR